MRRPATRAQEINSSSFDTVNIFFNRPFEIPSLAFGERAINVVEHNSVRPEHGKNDQDGKMSANLSILFMDPFHIINI